jgi:hypothetical protein
MRRIVDLTRPIDSADRELLPPEVGSIFAPRVRALSPAGDGAIRMSEAFGCPVEDLPGGEGWRTAAARPRSATADGLHFRRVPAAPGRPERGTGSGCRLPRLTRRRASRQHASEYLADDREA